MSESYSGHWVFIFVIIWDESAISMVGRVAAICGEAGFLPPHLAGGGTEVCLWPGGKGKIPHADADAGKIHRLPGGVLLPDVQSLSSLARSPADGGGGYFG